MTLIECFDRSPVDNMISCLQLRPDKLIFLGKEKEMQKSIGRYRRFLEGRSLHTEIVLQNLQMEDLDKIIRVLTDIVKKETDCVIDLTGGDERIIMAVGAVLASLDSSRRKHITVQHFDRKENAFTDCDGDGKVISGFDANLTVTELIALHGGIVHPVVDQPDRRYAPSDIEPLWEIACRDPRNWNKTVSALNEFQSRSFTETEVYVPLEPLESVISDFKSKQERVTDLLYALEKAGCIEDNSNSSAFHYRYTDPLLHLCLERAGNILELKTLLEARALKENGKSYFHDCAMSVSIDWDGILHDPELHIPETRNEIDVILLHRMTPLFISCKNGSIGEDELYKLHTVATRFGGIYAKKMLIATELPRKGSNPNYAFIQRAKDMGIYLVAEAAQLSVSGWREVLQRAIEE